MFYVVTKVVACCSTPAGNPTLTVSPHRPERLQRDYVLSAGVVVALCVPHGARCGKRSPAWRDARSQDHTRCKTGARLNTPVSPYLKHPDGRGVRSRGRRIFAEVGHHIPMREAVESGARGP